MFDKIDIVILVGIVVIGSIMIGIDFYKKERPHFISPLSFVIGLLYGMYLNHVYAEANGVIVKINFSLIGLFLLYWVSRKKRKGT